MHIHRPLATCFCFALASISATAQPPAREPATLTVLKPARVFDGETMHEGWVVLVRGGRIDSAGPAAGIQTTGAKTVDLAGATLMPGLVEGHSHILLHAYNGVAEHAAGRMLPRPEVFEFAQSSVVLVPSYFSLATAIQR